MLAPMTTASGGDEITLRVPANSAYARLARVGAAALALRQGLAFAEIDDLRLAMDEAMILLLDVDRNPAENDAVAIGTKPSPSEIAVTFRVADGRCEVEARRTDAQSVREEAVTRFAAIASDLVDEFEVNESKAWIRIVKQRQTNS